MIDEPMTFDQVMQFMIGPDPKQFEDSVNSASLNMLDFLQKECNGNFFAGMIAVNRVSVLMAQQIGMDRDTFTRLIGKHYDEMKKEKDEVEKSQDD